MRHRPSARRCGLRQSGQGGLGGVLAHIIAPLLVTDAELDPENFQMQADELTRARQRAGHPVARLHVVGHSHLSEAYAIGTADESVSGPALRFIREHSRAAGQVADGTK